MSKLNYKNLILFFAISIVSVTYAQKTISMDTVKTYRVPALSVTTNKAKNRVTPVPHSEITKSEIEEIYTNQDLPMIMSEMPSIIFYSESGNNIGYSNLTMRGFDQRRISVMINGIPQNDPEDQNFYWINISDFAQSVESIEVQRGAGMSNYGAAAIGGTINLTTENFAREKQITLRSGVGYQEFGDVGETRQNTSNFSLEFSSGLTDKYSFYGKLGRINSFGYRDQSWAYLNSYFFGIARFDENLTTQINVFGGSQNDGLVYTGLPKEYVYDEELRRENYNFWSYDTSGRNVNFFTRRRAQEIEEFQQPQFEILNDWQINDNLTLKSALFYKVGEGFFDYDGTGWTNANSFRLTPENGFSDNVADPQNPIIRAFVGNNYGGWIPRLVWDHGNGEFLIGAEARIHRSSHWGKIGYADNLPTGYNPDFKFYSYNGKRDIFSLFAQEKYFINEKLIVTGEAQLVHHRFAIANEKDGLNYTQYQTTGGSIVSGDDDLFNANYLFFNPRLGLNYNYSETMNVYGLVAYTSREPRMRNLYAASDSWFGATPLFQAQILESGQTAYDFDSPIINPERMLDFELGWGFVNNRINANVNFYWMEYFDELVRSGQLDIFGAPVDGNAPRTRHYGVELQATARLIESKYGNITLSGNSTISQNPIIEYDFITAIGDTVSLEGNEIAGFPGFMANLRLSYELNNLFLSAYMKHVGELRTDNFGDMINEDQRIVDHLAATGFYNDNVLDAYTVVNLDASYTFTNIPGIESFKVQGQIFNLTNELYAAMGFGQNFFPAAERNFFLGFELGL